MKNRESSLIVKIVCEWFSRAATWWILTGTWCVCCPSVNTRYPEHELVRWQTVIPWICCSRHVFTLLPRMHNEVLSDSWLGASTDRLKKALSSKLYNTWPKGDKFTDWRLGCNPGFWQCQCFVFACVFKFHGLSYISVPPLLMSGLLTLSPHSATPLRLPGTTPPGCYPPSRSPLTSSQLSHAEGGHPMPLM